MSTSVGFLSTIAPSACPLHDRRSGAAPCRRVIRPRVSCHSNGNAPQPPPSSLLMDRRDVLFALGGLTGGAAAAGKLALAAPVMPPDLTKCHDANSAGLGDHLKCCPPYTSAEITDYTFPDTPLRVRRAAQEVIKDSEYMEKYTTAVRLMKGKPPDHPWNFYQQALIHCAYCNEAYDQVGFLNPSVPIQVHFSWLFLPWHRYYLHFYERILGKLIDDDTFTLPFWNFDSDDGMTMPEIFTADTSSPLYNENRDTSHYSPAILDYKYSYGNTAGSGETGDALVLSNLCTMKKTFKQSLPLADLFMGDPLRAGQEADGSNGPGQLESIHNAVHMWVGTPESPHIDMGDFSTAGKDCIFFSLHANVDRLWHIYRNLRGNKLEFNDPDWLDSTFIFYDENEQVVRVKVRDCLNPNNLRYTYEEVPIPWMNKLNCVKTTETKEKTKAELSLVRVGAFGSEPRELSKTALRVMVSRPKKSRKKAEKEDKVEVLQIKDIAVDTDGPARFDVYIAAPYGDLAGPDYGDFAGTFVRLPHKGKGKKRKGALKLGITSLLEDLDAEDAEKLVVTLVPRIGEFTIGGVAIKLLQTDNPRLV
ncbi:polyphenol oxidase, chloroplastic-like [Phoenix dactylifera]|uniref:Polyphenol oxidase, chloroplastic-like n=1 Tax=Phoenix dactylifera TaxID=42345 RepID=A0A8B7CKL8_PHODC|nr:polyphenol oxidase, chloroplastic-like [Phoenix dactylifera]